MNAMTKENTLIVTPSVRKFPLENFIEVWNQGIPHMIIDDSTGRSDREPVDRSELKEFGNILLATREFVLDNTPVHTHGSDLFPVGTPACKNFGLYYAYKNNFEYVILLDDDVIASNFFIDQVPLGRDIATSKAPDRKWYNPLAQIHRMKITESIDSRTLYSRGYPYHERLIPQDEPTTKKQVLTTPLFNAGLWTGEPDINGMDKLEMADNDNLSSIDDKNWYINTDSFIWPKYVTLDYGQYYPLSIMNCQIASSLVPAFYMPTDFPAYGSYKFRRHDDVWAGMFLKTVMDIHKLRMTCGYPLVHHTRPSKLKWDMLGEHYSNFIQAYLEILLREAVNVAVGPTVKDTVRGISEYILCYDNWDMSPVPEPYLDILKQYADSTLQWLALFE